MKKLLLILLALIMCVSMCACGGNSDTSDTSSQNENVQIETVDISDLLDDLDNQAKAEMNIGKATTLFVQIGTIYSDHCLVSHVLTECKNKNFDPDSSLDFNYNRVSKLYMEKEQLAKLEKGEYAVFNAVVDHVSDFQYAFKDAQMQDISLFDEYLQKELSRDWVHSDKDIIHGHSRFLIEYCRSNGSHLKMKDDQEISDLIVGDWVYWDSLSLDNGLSIKGISNVSFYSNGSSVLEHIYPDSSGTYKWSVNGGIFNNSRFTNKYSIYKISDNIIVLLDCNYTLGDVYLRSGSKK